jgi:pre-mRNA-processing factor SLU7
MAEFDPDKPPEEGNLTGETLPEFVQKQPWYFQTPGDAIGHQRIAPYAEQLHTNLSDYYHHGKGKKKEVVKWKPGCCHNCGAPGHSEYECPERPRKHNARVSGQGVVVKTTPESHALSFDAKHDTYAGYDANRWWNQVSGQFRYADQVRAKAAPNPQEETVIQAEYGNSGFRNRQDIAPYLQNLSKTSLSVPKDDDMWDKASGTEPPRKPPENASEARKREFFESKELMARSSELKEEFVEEKVPRSRYGDEEDRFVNGHSSVYGSYFADGRWGYACCHQFERDCFCTRPVC